MEGKLPDDSNAWACTAAVMAPSTASQVSGGDDEDGGAGGVRTIVTEVGEGTTGGWVEGVEVPGRTPGPIGVPLPSEWAGGTDDALVLLLVDINIALTAGPNETRGSEIRGINR